MSWDTELTGTALNIAGTTNSPLRVMAGPGTGKTFAMKRRVARLLEEGVNPGRILAVTFTRTAAANFVKELHQLGIQGCHDIRAGTLHAFSFSLLMKEAVFRHTGRIPRPLITFTKSAVLQFEAAPMLHDLNNNSLFGSNRDRTKRVLAFEAAWARLQSDTPGWPTDLVDREFHRELINWLTFHRAMLIGELVPEALTFLRNNPTSPELSAFDHVIVDEYQDLNKAEQEFVDLLASNGSNAIVGDEDQSIFSFRHAHPEGIRDFAFTHSSTHDEILTECRRCPSQVVEMANHLISQNHPIGSNTRLRPFPSNPTGQVQIVQWPLLEEEAAGIARYVEHLVQTRGYNPGDILILSPRRLIGYGIRERLRERDIATHSFYHEESLEPDEAKQAFSMLILLSDKNDRVSLRYWLGCESPTWLTGEYERLREYCTQSGISPWDALEQIESGTSNVIRTNKLVARFSKLKNILAPLQSLCGDALVDELFPANDDWAKPLREAASIIAKPDTNASTLLDSLEAEITQPEMPAEGDFVRIMSLHKSKGLTSKVVIVAGCMHSLIPFINRQQTPAEQEANLQEQRRLFYVAITRCKEVLLLSSARLIKRRLAHKIGAMLRGGGGPYGSTIASQFITELGPAAPATKDGHGWVRNGFA